jgi:hypothetical protein
VICYFEFLVTPLLQPHLFVGVTTSIGNQEMLRLNPYAIQLKVKALELKYGSY